jgi:hypothetical protein
MQYIMIDVANSFGLDKLTWNERLDWFDNNKNKFTTATWDELIEMGKEAEEPAQFMAGINAYRHALNGEATGYLCGLDATASGIQLLSVMAGCERSAAMCNLVNTGKREDAYTTAYEEVCRITQSEMTVVRKAVKQALMTHFYGSKAAPRNAFGKDTPELAAFYQMIDELLPGADMLNRDLLDLWQPDAYAHSWILPDGFDVVVNVMAPVQHSFEFLGTRHEITEYVNQPQESGLSLGANVVHSIDGMVVREMGRRCDYRADQVIKAAACASGYTTGGKSTKREKDLALMRVLEAAELFQFMSAVVFEYLDESNAGHLTATQAQSIIDLIQSLPSKPFHILAIHDCFKFHANYGNDVREQYKTILADLADSNVLSAIAGQITGKPMPVTKLSNKLSVLIHQSEYALS